MSQNLGAIAGSAIAYLLVGTAFYQYEYLTFAGIFLGAGLALVSYVIAEWDND